jgi:DNA-3-methyladenine glycosylase
MRAARIAWLARRRGLSVDALERERARLASLKPERLARGPGLVTAALSIDRSDNGADLCDLVSSLRLEAAPGDDRWSEVISGRRVGIGYAGEPWIAMPWRFAIRGNRAVSGPPIRS